MKKSYLSHYTTYTKTPTSVQVQKKPLLPPDKDKVEEEEGSDWCGRYLDSMVPNKRKKIVAINKLVMTYETRTAGKNLMGVTMQANKFATVHRRRMWKFSVIKREITPTKEFSEV